MPAMEVVKPLIAGTARSYMVICVIMLNSYKLFNMKNTKGIIMLFNILKAS